MRRIIRWLDDRTGAGQMLQAFLDRPIPKDIGWLHTFGSALLFLISVQFVTGTLLALNYAASPGTAYASVRYLQEHVLFGALLRGVHLWTGSAIVLLIGLHILRTFFYGAYKYPREVTWLTGVGLLLVVMGFSFTGYLLPWDQKAYWATVVGTNIAGAAPLVGQLALRLLRGGTAIGAATLARFYGFHVLILPAAVVLFGTVHLFMVIRHGIAAPPRRRPLVEPLRGESARDWYWREYAAEKRRGKPFYEALLKDALVAATLFTLILVLAQRFGAPLGPAADPNSTNFVPRPEWYFLDLFQLLWYVKGKLEPIGTFLIPTLFILLLLALPFFDHRRERHPLKRPVATAAAALAVALVATLTYLGATAPAPGGAGTSVSSGPLTPEQAAGAKLFAQQGCVNCHTIGNLGGNVGPNLTHVGSRLSRQQLVDMIAHGKKAMPAFKSLTPEELGQIAAFLQSRR